MQKVAVITDSSSYLTDEQLKENNIYVIPDPIIFGNKVVHDIDYKNDNYHKFFEEVEEISPELPTTSQPAPTDILDVFNQVKDDGYPQAIVVVLSQGISGTYSTVNNLASDFEGLDITVWNSQTAGLGSGNQAVYASLLSKKGFSKEEIINKLDILRGSTNTLIVVDSIKHLQRTGRIGSGQAMLAGMLNIKPILSFVDEKVIAIGKARRMSGAWQFIETKLKKAVEQSSLPMRVDIIDTENRELSDQWANTIHSLWPDIEVSQGIVSPFIAVHTGPKAIGFFFSYDYKKLLGNL
ncbi:MAG: DegV family protein [Lactobacillaceae bacterium]|jgi:DegV family protein with EDD domain|nr:DegV family protein [Lactobacillaceae bacterium]